ncbi:MAG TPA: hypothetical protein VGJ25_14490 [Gaiellaceae bacterium]
MDEACHLLARLARIEALDREQAPALALLEELRELVVEAEAWARAERPGSRAETAIDACRLALDAAPREVAMM